MVHVKALTFFGFGNILILPLCFLNLTRVVNRQDNIPLVVKANITVASKVHLELVVCRLRGSLELHLQCLNIESRLSGSVQDGLVESGEGEGRNSDLALTRVGEEKVPAGRVVAREVGSVSERGLMLLLLGGVWTSVGLGVGLVGVDVFEVRGVDIRDVASTRIKRALTTNWTRELGVMCFSPVTLKKVRSMTRRGS